jgi:hypothetical protein
MHIFDWKTMHICENSRKPYDNSQETPYNSKKILKFKLSLPFEIPQNLFFGLLGV